MDEAQLLANDACKDSMVTPMVPPPRPKKHKNVSIVIHKASTEMQDSWEAAMSAVEYANRNHRFMPAALHTTSRSKL